MDAVTIDLIDEGLTSAAVTASRGRIPARGGTAQGQGRRDISGVRLRRSRLTISTSNSGFIPNYRDNSSTPVAHR
jgi:hypothetical protein